MSIKLFPGPIKISELLQSKKKLDLRMKVMPQIQASRQQHFVHTSYYIYSQPSLQATDQAESTAAMCQRIDHNNKCCDSLYHLLEYS
jgi:hypothetical protein